jgi:hypothetical protein
LWIRDWKTTSVDKKEYFEQTLNPADQTNRYHFGGRKLHNSDGSFGGLMYECIRIPKAEKDKDKIPKKPEIFTSIQTRQSVERDRWLKDQLYWNAKLRESRETDHWAQSEHSCGFCPFASVCRRPSEVTQMAKLESDFVKKPWDFNNVDQEGE